ncbi:unnamed protein product [marine sediment metagenome]|uniref:Uncharacterized protein n=1 Tax=marine sediment metagenome TaxID=412755 RepID=X1Q1Y1_9ZZZZ
MKSREEQQIRDKVMKEIRWTGIKRNILGLFVGIGAAVIVSVIIAFIATDWAW